MTQRKHVHVESDRDAAMRCSDLINGLITFNGIGAFGKWVAIRLIDGTSDGNLYDTKADAVRHQLHENLCAYVCIVPTGMSFQDALSYLRTHRKMYDAGLRLADPDKHVVPSNRRENLR